ncbi:hypothetical protein L6250_01475 [Candidatus Parcubacteria bacterium]|nr:hypothetical protein [Candidatus Parcubacteria bacterium]
MVNVEEYVRKINKVEAMLEDIKEAFLCFDKEFQDSVNKGERDIKEGKVTVCKTEDDLNDFFASL